MGTINTLYRRPGTVAAFAAHVIGSYAALLLLLLYGGTSPGGDSINFAAGLCAGPIIAPIYMPILMLLMLDRTPWDGTGPVAPIWQPITVWALYGGVWTIVFMVVRARAAKRVLGLCRNCGYDLRATPSRCPECGWVAGRNEGDPNL